MSKLNFVTLDVFTDTRFKGNPLAISQIPRNPRLEQDRKQARPLRANFHLSETVFPSSWEWRIFEKDRNWHFHYKCRDTLCRTRRPEALSAILFAQIGSHHQILWHWFHSSHKSGGTVAASFWSWDKIEATADIPHNNVKLHQTSVHWKYIQYIVELQPSLTYFSTRQVVRCRVSQLEEGEMDGLDGQTMESAAEFPSSSHLCWRNERCIILVRFFHCLLTSILKSFEAIRGEGERLQRAWQRLMRVNLDYLSYNGDSLGLYILHTTKPCKSYHTGWRKMKIVRIHRSMNN